MDVVAFELLNVTSEYSARKRLGHIIGILVGNQLIVTGYDCEWNIAFVVVQSTITRQDSFCALVAPASGRTHGNREKCFIDISEFGFSLNVYHGICVLVFCCKFEESFAAQENNTNFVFLPRVSRITVTFVSDFKPQHYGNHIQAL